MHEDELDGSEVDSEDSIENKKREFRKYNIGVKDSYLKKGGCDTSYFVTPKVVMKDKILNVYDKHVFTILLGHVRKRGGGGCYPSIPTISEECCVCERQVRLSLKALKNNFWIDWIRTGGSNEYRIFSFQEHTLLVDNSKRACPEKSDNVLKLFHRVDRHVVPHREAK